MAHSHPDTGVDDGWPWNCARCGTTIYHDAVHCRTCEQRDSPDRRRADGFALASVCRTWVQWIERQTYASLVATSSAIATVELLLTALWLQVLFLGVPAVPYGVVF